MVEHHSPTALAYARSLLELANERGQTEAVANDVDAIASAVADVPSVRSFFADPGVSPEEKEKLIETTFGNAEPLVLNFLRLLNARHRLRELAEFCDAFEYLLDEQLGKIEVDVTVAERLSDEDLERVRAKVGQAFGKDAVVHQYVDPEIIGGLIIRAGDQIIDASVRRQLETMRERLLRRG